MISILANLNPRFELAETILFEELDEVNELIFISKGTVDVGYTINGSTHYALRFVDKVMVAVYESTLGVRTMANYKCKTFCEGYCINQGVWKGIVDTPIAEHIGAGIKVQYYEQIYRKIVEAKASALRGVYKRKDYQNIATLQLNLDPSCGPSVDQVTQALEDEVTKIKAKTYEETDDGQDWIKEQAAVEEKMEDQAFLVAHLLHHVDNLHRQNVTLSQKLQQHRSEIKSLKSKAGPKTTIAQQSPRVDVPLQKKEYA